MRTEEFWAQRRARLCLAAGVVNLNAGTCSPVARETLAALSAAQLEQAEDPVQFVFRKAPLALEETRHLLAQFMDCEPTSLLLFNNATYGVNTVARALTLAPGDEVLLSDQEYHNYLTLWQRIAAETGAKLVTVPLPLPEEEAATTPAALTERFAEALTSRTKVLFFSHVTSATGLALPATELCRLAREHGVMSVVDGAHALGMIPVALREMRPDYYAANVHKWMTGPIGSAVLYVAPERRAATPPLVTTGTYDFDFALADQPVHPAAATGPTRWVASHEYQGTRNYIPLLAAAAAVRFHAEVPLAAVRERTDRLAARSRALLTRHGLPSVSHEHPELATCLVAGRAPTPGGRRIDVVKAFWRVREEYGCELSFPTLPDGSALLRVSNAWFNTEGDLERLDSLLGMLDWERFV